MRNRKLWQSHLHWPALLMIIVLNIKYKEFLSFLITNYLLHNTIYYRLARVAPMSELKRNRLQFQLCGSVAMTAVTTSLILCIFVNDLVVGLFKFWCTVRFQHCFCFICIIYKMLAQHWMASDATKIYDKSHTNERLPSLLGCGKNEPKLFYPRHVKTYFLITGVKKPSNKPKTKSFIPWPIICAYEG